jgi:hypothetical protein
MIRHVVLMTFKDTTRPEDVARVAKALDDSASKVDYVLSISHGVDVPVGTPSPKAHYAVVIDFATVEDCVRYDRDPEHLGVREVVLPLVASVLVTNFEVVA